MSFTVRAGEWSVGFEDFGRLAADECDVSLGRVCETGLQHSSGIAGECDDECAGGGSIESMDGVDVLCELSGECLYDVSAMCAVALFAMDSHSAGFVDDDECGVIVEDGEWFAFERERDPVFGFDCGFHRSHMVLCRRR